jgi:phage protein D
MPHHDALHWPQVKIDGTALPSEVELLLDEVVVDHSLHLPDMFSIRLRDRDGQVLQHAGAEIGKKVTISASSASGDVALIDGEITGMEANYESAGGALITIRGYDSSHRLHRGRTTATYLNVKDSDIVRTVCQKAGIQPGQIDETSGTFDHVSQANLSFWDFLQSRAKPIGYELAVVASKLNFRKPIAASGAPGSGDYRSSDPLQLVFGQELLEFRPRLTSAEQVANVKVRGWDPKTKQAVIGSASAGTTSTALPHKPDGLSGKFGSPTYAVVTLPVADQTEANVVAKATAEAVGSVSAEAEGVARGNPKLVAGTAVNVSEVASPFAGSYTLSHTRHVFGHDGYLVHFTISGRQERSLLGLASGGNGAVSTPGSQPIMGMVVAQVTGNDDPDKLGRVKLKFPWLSDDYESHWARVTQLGAGPDSGALFLPETGDEVLVAFEHGDIHRPYVIGSLYNGQDKPKLGDGLFDNGKVKRRGFVSRKGHKFILFDDANKSGVALITGDGQIKVALDETNKEIHIACGSGTVVVECNGDLSLESKTGKITLKAQQDIELNGMNIKAEAQTQLQLKGATTELNGSGQTTIKGGMVAIN